VFSSFFQCCCDFKDPDAICWSFVNSSQYPMIPFILFIHQFFYKALQSLYMTLFSNILTMLHPVIFTICSAIRKISFSCSGALKSLAHSFCFFSIVDEITFHSVYSSCTPSMPLSGFLSSNFHTLSSFPLLHKLHLIML